MLSSPCRTVSGPSRDRVVWISHDGLEPVMHPVLPYVVRFEDSEVWELLLRLLLGDILQTHGPSVSCHAQGFLSAARSWSWLSSSTLSNADANNDVTLLRFVAQGSGSFDPCRVLNSVDCRLSSPFDCKFSKILFELLLVSHIPSLRQVLVHAHWIFLPQPILMKL